MHARSPFEQSHDIAQLLARYAHCIDDDRLEEWPDFFTDACDYRVVTRDNVDRGLPLAAIACHSRGMLRDRVVSLRHANVYEKHRYRHLVSNVLIDSAGETLRVRSSFAVYRTRTNGASDVFLVGMYDDEIVAAEGGWKFRRRTVICDTSRVDTLLVTPL